MSKLAYLKLSENDRLFLERVTQSKIFMSAYTQQGGDTSNYLELFDFAVDYLRNEPETIEAHDAWGSGGHFVVEIRELDNIFFVAAIKFDTERFHLCLKNAQWEAEDIYSNFVEDPE